MVRVSEVLVLNYWELLPTLPWCHYTRN